MRVVFNAASPRHTSLRGGSFFTIEKQDEATQIWNVVRTDSDLDTT